MPRYFYLFITFFFLVQTSKGTIPLVKKNKQPKRIIRMCCAFGTKIKVFGLPFITLNKIVNVHTLGNHNYLNDKYENNGIIYTKKAGFIDIAHVRDQADWTAYLFQLLSKLPKEIYHEINLGQELGNKVIKIKIPENITKLDMINMAGNISYNLSTWHEIASWFGATKFPILNEKFSSFSFEDNFSNGLGVELGKQALISQLDYNLAMDSLLLNYLSEAHGASDNNSTEDAMLNIAQTYWNPQKSIPNKKLLVERNFNCSNKISPIVFEGDTVLPIEIAYQTSHLVNFKDIYTLHFKAGYRFPLKKVLPNKSDRLITSQDFEEIIAYIKAEIIHKI